MTIIYHNEKEYFLQADAIYSDDQSFFPLLGMVIFVGAQGREGEHQGMNDGILTYL